MRPPISHIVATLLVLALAACAESSTDPSGGLRIEPDAAEYRPGEDATLEVSNLLRSAIGIGICPKGMYKEDDPGAGTLVPMTLPCPAVLVTLRSGHSTSMFMPVPEGTAAGEYRFAVGYSVGSSSFESRSAVVRVQAD